MLLDAPDLLVRSLFTRPPGEHGPILHAAIGLAGESGELLDAVKKAWAYGAPLDIPNCREELGDLFFYWIAACISLNIHPQTIIDENVKKLNARYPSGEFTPTDALARKDKSQ